MGDSTDRAAPPLAEVASCIEVHLIREEGSQRGEGIFRIFLGKGWSFLRGAPLGILCPYMGFLFLLLAAQGVSSSMLMSYSERIRTPCWTELVPAGV